jgi:signal transduction histidine kinase/DNA-binding response OmpR family regulator
MVKTPDSNTVKSMSKENKSPLVLVVDDQQPAAVMLQRLFEHHGYTVECAYDGLSALRMAREKLPDLILLDVLMPGISGFEVLEKLREDPTTARIPAIMITALDEPDSIAKGLQLGADDYIPKPFKPRELLARAVSKMKARKLEDSLQRRTQELEVLLRVSEALNDRREVHELLSLIPSMTLDLLPGDAALIYHLTEQGDILDFNLQCKSAFPDSFPFNHERIIDHFMAQRMPIRWGSIDPMIEGISHGIACPIIHGDTISGVLLMLSFDHEYDAGHLRLCESISRQAGLALRNAELYEVQASYAMHLEETVARRTAELQSAQQMLVRAEKLASIGHLAASIAHEINNPLQPIVVILDDMLLDAQQGIPVDVRGIQLIQESVSRISRIVRQLLDFTAKRSSGSEVDLIQIDQVLNTVIGLNQKLYQQAKLQIVANLQPLPPVYGSKDQLEQVFMNLIINASHAMQPGGVLTINMRREENEVVIDFVDTGHGIPQEILDKIFDPFFSTKPQGTGLGLFVSYGIIQGHNGEIEVESSLNKGTRFTIRLPMVSEAVK